MRSILGIERSNNWINWSESEKESNKNSTNGRELAVIENVNRNKDATDLQNNNKRIYSERI
jgi:hypothetical protein